MEETIEGYVDHIIFRNEDNGYTVMVVIAEEEELTCVGSFQYLSEGETIKAYGHYTEHPSYGRQFSVTSYETVVPQDSMAMERYLGPAPSKGSERLLPPGSSGVSRTTLCVSWRRSRSGWQRSRASVRRRPGRSLLRCLRRLICGKP